MAKTLTDYILNPFYHIYYFFRGNDFLINGSMKYFYFILNLILSFIITICGCIYNEFIVLFFWKLEYDTHDQVTKRAKSAMIIQDVCSSLSEEEIIGSSINSL